MYCFDEESINVTELQLNYHKKLQLRVDKFRKIMYYLLYIQFNNIMR